MGFLTTKLLLLLAVLLLPLGMAPAAAGPSPAQTAHAMPGGHCPDGTSGHAKSGLAECTMACAAALPAFFASADEAPATIAPPQAPRLAARLFGLHPETATPPPRIS